MPEPQVIVEQTVQRYDPLTHATHPFYRVYVWAVRPDAAGHIPSDQYHWALDSEHRTLELANKRRDALLAGSTEPGNKVESRSRWPGIGSPELGRPKLTLHLGEKRDEQNG